MARSFRLGTLLVAVLTCSLAVSTPKPVLALRCCALGYITSQYWVMKPTCSEAQAAFRTAALPEAQAVCAPEFVCQITIPSCYSAYDAYGNLVYVVDGLMNHGCTYSC